MSFVKTKDDTDILFKDWGPKSARTLVFHHGRPCRRLGRTDVVLYRQGISRRRP